MKRPNKLLLAGATLSTSILLSGCTSPLPHDLSKQETVEISQAFQLGRMGLQAYNRALDSTNSAEASGDVLSFTDSNLVTFPDKSIPLGQQLKIGEQDFAKVGSASELETITPSRNSSTTSVKYSSAFSNLGGNTTEAATFSNPDPNFFQDDLASPDEMAAFYTDPATQLTTASFKTKDLIAGSTAFSAHRVGKRLLVHLVEHDGYGHDTTPDFNETTVVDAVKHDVLYE